MVCLRLAPYALRQPKVRQQPITKAHEFKYTWLSLRTLLAVALASLAQPFLAAFPAPGAASLLQQVSALYEQQSHVKSIGQVAISPNGVQVAWSVDGPTPGASAIYLSGVAHPANPTRVTAGSIDASCYENEPSWSPNGSQLAFLSDCATRGQAQLFVQTLTNPPQPPRQLTHFHGFVSHLHWSPDGRQIALLYVDHSTRTPSPMAAENKAVGVIDDLQNTDVQRLSVTDLRTGQTRPASPAGLYVFEFDWSPDARQFLYTAAAPPGDDNWYIAKLYTQPCDRPAPVSIFQPKFQIALPRWSPDGQSVSFIGGLMSDEGGTGGELYLLPAAGGQPRNLTPSIPSSPAWYRWLSRSKILLTQFVGGSSSIGILNTSTNRIQTIWTGSETIHSGLAESSLSVALTSAGPQTALVRTSWSQLPEVWAGSIGNWKPITQINAKSDLPLPQFKNVQWQNGAFHVQGWLLFPQNYNPARRYPMLVAVHGGPAWIATPEWRAADFDTTLFTNFGYFVFFPNARGSYGEGERFTQANRRDWGFGDLSDMLSGVDALTRQYPAVDPRRVGILGWSYGGSTAMIAVARTHRFRAAVAGAGAGNWQSYYGQNSIDKWMIPYFGASVYDDPAAYARSSALTYIKSAKTPTLVVVGERDGEAPPAQSIEFWHALKELGVPTRLVIYAGEGHSFFKPADRIDVTVRTLEWFMQYMPE